MASEHSLFPAVYNVARKECTTPDTVDYVHKAKQQTTGVKLVSKLAYENMRPQFKWTNSHHLILSDWLEDRGQKLMVGREDNKESVLALVTSLTDHIRDEECIPESTAVKFDVKILGIGSCYSRTKKHPADEFDFLCEYQMTTGHLRFVHQPLPITETTDFSKPDLFRIYDENN